MADHKIEFLRVQVSPNARITALAHGHDVRYRLDVEGNGQREIPVDDVRVILHMLEHQ
jgi:hypothetical protein